MHDPIKLELTIDSIDTTLIRSITDRLEGVEILQVSKTRNIDPTTILGIISGSITLLNALTQLIKALRRQADGTKQITIIVKNEQGGHIDLQKTSETELKDFIQQSKKPQDPPK
jgi:predicted transcriptional regulator